MDRTHAPRVAYVMSRFPRLSETFVLFEMVALEAAGADVELFPLIRERSDVVHPQAHAFVDRMHYAGVLDHHVLVSNLWWLRHDLCTYVGTLGSALRGTFRSLNFLFGAIATFPKVAHYARVMRAVGVDHVHCHFATHPALAGFVIHRLTGIPYSFTAHGSDLHVDRTMLGTKVDEAAFVVAISEFNRRMILEECPSGIRTDHVEVIHCGVDTDVLVPGVAVGGHHSEVFRILQIGTLHEVKGQRYLLGACAQLARRGVALSCVLVGDGPDRPKLVELCRELGISDLVSMVGLRTRDQVVEHLAASDVLVAPSVPTNTGKREGIPVVLMEAMSAGLPVVSSHISGIPELVVDGMNGLLVEPFDIEALADALERLATDSDVRRRLGEAGRATIERDFDVNTNARTLLELISVSKHCPAVEED